MAAYLGQEGYCIEFELQKVKEHCQQKGTPELVARVLENVCQLTDRPILLKLDGGYDVIENVAMTFNETHPQ